MGFSAPLDKIFFCIFWIVAAYIPSLIFTLLASLMCPKKQTTVDPALFQYNVPDASELAAILKAMTAI